ncbi:hypothetical protein [Lysobacter capsici]|uniref:hypothetical protein n=1 Tax=Lysobacter capsici TaxID=435897 RepID=UPI00062827DD|nr:hypothetical protein [Lysobacter capsici]
MATDSYSFLFLIPESEAPEGPLDLEQDPELQALYQKHCEGEYHFTSTSRGAYVESWVMDRLDALPGLKYITRPAVLLRHEDIVPALDSLEAAFGVIARTPEQEFHGFTGYPIAQALLDSDDELSRRFAGEGEDPYYLIQCLRAHRDILMQARRTASFVLYFSFHPYFDSE